MAHKVLCDSELWERREESAAALAREVGIDPSTFRKWCLRRGWRRDNTGRILKAPCAKCNVSSPVEDLNEDRLCLLHWGDTAYCEKVGIVPGTDAYAYKMELRNWLRRNPGYRSGQVVGGTWESLRAPGLR